MGRSDRNQAEGDMVSIYGLAAGTDTLKHAVNLTQSALAYTQAVSGCLGHCFCREV